MTAIALPSERVVHVTRADLPLSCPGNDPEIILFMHPRVWLPLGEVHEKLPHGYVTEALCPYCSTRYILSED
jgi:uncharacterized Zn-finger protein